MREFRSWYLEQHPLVLAACSALAADLDIATEATDEAFARACERWAKVSVMEAPGGWVQAVALNHLRRSLRRRSFEHRLLRRPITDAVAPPPDPELWILVRSLPARQQTALVLRYVHGLSAEAIATSMSISVNTVSPTLDAARRTLRRLLSDPIPDEENAHGRP